MSFNRTHLRTLANAWQAAGLGHSPIAAVVDEANIRHDRLHAQKQALEASRDQNRRTIIDRLALGELDLLDAVIAEHAATAAGPEQRQRITDLYGAAADRISRLAHAQLVEYGDLFVTDHLAPACAEIVALFTDLAPTIADVDDDQAAVRIGGTARDAWGKLTDALDRHAHLKRVRLELGKARVVPALPDWISSDYSAFRHPDRRPLRLQDLHPIQRFAALVDAGTGPGFYTATQAEQHQADDVKAGLHVETPDEAKAARRRATRSRPQVVDLPHIPAEFGTGEPDDVDPAKLAASVPRARS